MKWPAGTVMLICLAGIAMAGGGETIETASVIPSLPYEDTGSTCGHQNDYDEACPYGDSTGPDVVYAFTPPSDVAVMLDLCGSGYDSKLYVYAEAPPNLVACNDDGCGETWMSQIPWLNLSAGTTYYIVVDGYGTACGGYILDVLPMAPCVVVCPEGAIHEGEGPCVDGYQDSYNSGCYGSGWTPILPQEGGCGELCGRSCTYRSYGEWRTDRDWYVVTASGGPVTASVEAEFPVSLTMFYELDCATPQWVYGSGSPCQNVQVARTFQSGEEVWLMVEPSIGQGLSESDYVLQVCGIGGNPTAVAGTTWGQIKSRYR